MATESSSYRRILKSTSIIGGASFSNIAIGLLRSKVIALLLGPAGMGVTSLYTGLISTASTLSTLGLGTAGTRQIAEAVGSDDLHTLRVARRALLWGTLFLALAGGVVVWLLRDFLAAHVFGDQAFSRPVGWLSIGVALSVAGSAQAAVIQGMRRIADIAKLSIVSSALSTALGIVIIWRWGQAGLVFYVLSAPLAAFVVGHFFVSRLPELPPKAIALHELRQEWTMLLRLGLALTCAGLVQSFSQLWIRSTIAKSLGAEALGQYQAAWTISMQYVGFVLTAMGTDYYPRLTGMIRDANASIKLINEQTEVAILLSGPIFVAIISFSPSIIHLLYARSFAPSSDLLQWQVLGDVLKVASWPLGFAILANGDGKLFFWTESIFWLMILGLIIGLVPLLGLPITGIAYLFMYSVYLPVMYVIVRQRLGFRWDRSVKLLAGATFAACIGMDVLSHISVRLSVPIGFLLTLAFSILAAVRLNRKGEVGGGLAGRCNAAVRQLRGRLGL